MKDTIKPLPIEKNEIKLESYATSINSSRKSGQKQDRKQDQKIT
jgi:hypothetical protein